MAYATLRDPTKRQAYDASIGLEPEPIQPKPEPFVHPALGSLMAASPRKPAPPTASRPAPALERELRHQPEFEATPRIEPQSGASDYTHYFTFDERLAPGAHEVEWKRTGMMIGGVVLAACLLGGLAGWWSASDIGETQLAASDVSPAQVPAKLLEIAEAPLPAPALPEIGAQPAPPRRAVAARPKQAARPPIVAEEQSPERFEEPSQSQPSTTEPIAAVAPVAPAATSAMPLPNKVVARTIERIGYSCGAVASASAVEGRAGVYNVTCTSGRSYQAKPVNGRYRFKRLGR